MDIKKLILIFALVSSFACAKEDIIYSQKYFDSLIQSSKEYMEQAQTPATNAFSDITPDIGFELISPDFEAEDTPVFKLKIETEDKFKYDEIKKADTKIEIPLTDKFSFIYNTSKSKNKYNSNDYRIALGAAIKFNKVFSIDSGIETNYRSKDQNPTSKKIYFNPCFDISDRISLGFYNKINTLDHSVDNDIGLKVSPFRSKFMDFGIYSGITRATSGDVSRSMSFSTNFYF